PSAVRLIRRVVRLKSVTPNASSSRLTACPTAAADRSRWRAAAAKLPSSAVRAKAARADGGGGRFTTLALECINDCQAGQRQRRTAPSPHELDRPLRLGAVAVLHQGARAFGAQAARLHQGAGAV